MERYRAAGKAKGSGICGARSGCLSGEEGGVGHALVVGGAPPLGGHKEGRAVTAEGGSDSCRGVQRQAARQEEGRLLGGGGAHNSVYATRLHAIPSTII